MLCPLPELNVSQFGCQISALIENLTDCIINRYHSHEVLQKNHRYSHPFGALCFMLPEEAEMPQPSFL